MPYVQQLTRPNTQSSQSLTTTPPASRQPPEYALEEGTGQEHFSPNPDIFPNSNRIPPQPSFKETFCGPKHPANPQARFPSGACLASPSFGAIEQVCQSALRQQRTSPSSPEKTISKIRGRTSQSVRTSGLGNHTWAFLLMMLSMLGVAQALTDCEILNAWVPEKFNATGMECCEVYGLYCDLERGRVTHLYAEYHLICLGF
jgi:hypothetical protein